MQEYLGRNLDSSVGTDIYLLVPTAPLYTDGETLISFSPFLSSTVTSSLGSYFDLHANIFLETTPPFNL